MKSNLNSRTHSSKRSDDAEARAQLREAAASTRDGVIAMGSAAKDVARSELDHLGDEFASLRDDMLEKAAEKPLKALLIAAGAGVIVGLLLRRSS